MSADEPKRQQGDVDAVGTMPSGRKYPELHEPCWCGSNLPAGECGRRHPQSQTHMDYLAKLGVRGRPWP